MRNTQLSNSFGTNSIAKALFKLEYLLVKRKSSPPFKVIANIREKLAKGRSLLKNVSDLRFNRSNLAAPCRRLTDTKHIFHLSQVTNTRIRFGTPIVSVTEKKKILQNSS